MATIVDYQYIPEVSTLDALHNLASDTTNGYSQDLPGVNTFLINGANQITNIPEGEGGLGIAGWSTNVSWSSSNYNTISWSSGKIFLPDGTELTVSSGSKSGMFSTTYIYYDRETNSVKTTTSAAASVGENKILLCVASPTASGKKAQFQAFGTGDQSTFISASNIAANTITGNEIQANSITAGELDVSYLSAISANLGTITAGDITGTTITAGSTSGTGIRLNPSSQSIQIYYGGTKVGEISGGSVDGNGGILINSDYAGMIGRDTFDLKNAKLRIPVGTNLYD